MLITWPRAPLETPEPIAVQLVIEQPPPPPPLPAEPKPAAKPPPPGRLSSDDFAPAEGPKTPKGSGEAPPSAGEPPPPATETQAAETPPAKPAPPVEQSNEEPRPPTETQTAELPPPKPAPPPPKPKPPKEQATVRMPKPLGDMWPLPLEPNESRRTAARIGPTATRDEYCAYALNLTLRHIDLLPRSLIGERRGATVLSIRVLEDGTIKNVMVARSSGYPDIDARVEQMVYAVGRFPPLPQWVTRPWMDFTFQLHFPHPLEH
jgi:protein TonB